MSIYAFRLIYDYVLSFRIRIDVLDFFLESYIIETLGDERNESHLETIRRSEMSTKDCIVERIVNYSFDIQKHEVDFLRSKFGIDIRSEEELYKLPNYKLVDVFEAILKIKTRNCT